MANYSIDSLAFGGDTHIFTLPYAICITEAATAAKDVIVSNFSLETGARILVKFSNTNTNIATTTLNVNSLGAKSLFHQGAAIPTNFIIAGTTYDLVYDGTQWEIIGIVSLPSLGITATSTELNYMDGVTSNVQTQLNNLANIKANKADIATTASLGYSNSTVTYFKISDFGNWGTGAWYEKGFSMLVSSRAGETVWVSVSSDDSNTNAKAIRLLNTYSKIVKLYYSVAESAIYVQANAWCNNINAHILSNINGDYVPTVVHSSTLASDAVEIAITELGPTGTTVNIGHSSKALTLLGNATNPTYNGNSLALSSDLGAYVKLDGTSTMTGSLHIQASNPYVHFKDTGYSTDWYVQAYQDYFYVGATSSSAVRVDKNGNLMSPGTVKIGNAVTLQYNSTDKSLDFIF